MVRQSLEKRLQSLEAEVIELRKQVAEGRKKDWRRTIGAYSDDPGMLDILQEAMKLREQDRAKARAKNSRTKRKKS